MRRTESRSLAALAVVFVLGISLPAFAEDEALVLRMRAEQLAAAGNCDEAITKAQRAQSIDPTDGTAAVIEGRCLLLLKRYEDAIQPLEKARQLDPSIGGIAADLAAVHYHRGEFADAERELAKAEVESADDPRTALYRGLLLLETKQDGEAAQSFERASRMDAAIDPLATYYAGLAWERARDSTKARAALERLKERAPDDPWAREAEIALDRLDGRRGSGDRRWWGSLTGGAEWDDNVVLRGDGTGLPSNISSQSDTRAFWSAEGGVELLRGKDWAGGVIAGYHGNAHFRTHEFDLQYPTASLWLDRRVDGKSFLRLQPFAGYAWTETDPYLFNAGGTASYHRNFGTAGSGRLYGQYSYRNYLFSPQGDITLGPLVDAMLKRTRDRDGDEYRAGYDHAISLHEDTKARVGAAYAYYDSEGGEFSHDRYGGHVGVNQDLPGEFNFDVEGGYIFLDFDRASTFRNLGSTSLGSPDRRDHVIVARARLSRPITDWLSAEAHWRWTDNNSNTRAFNYDRHVVGGSMTVTFGPR